jgi:hypothetical protein
MSPTLACGPSFEDLVPFLIIAGLGLVAVKTLMYVAFVQAFRYRVAAPVPMTRRQAWGIAGLRAAIGILIIGTTWLVLFFSSVGDNPAIGIIWTIGACERLAVWFGLGLGLAKLHGRRLAGWTISGTGLDLACDAALFFTGQYGLTSPLVGGAGIVVFIAVLFVVGRRASLLSRFTERPLCRSCAYDLTGNLSGICPECGSPIVGTAPAV